jgi:hypothetical protein
MHAAADRVKRILLNQTSLGYIAPGLLLGSKPDQPSMLSSFFGTENLSGSNSFGRSQKYGDRWRLYTCRAKIHHKASHGMDQTIYNAVKFRAICAAQDLAKVPHKNNYTITQTISKLQSPNSPKQIYQSRLVFHIRLLLHCTHLHK